ncbi:MAG: FAD-dependent oxidoreductase [Firmicutes bacterium]|nr:FAD-dependent oxidoreductase [Bacillota bacterium]
MIYADVAVIGGGPAGMSAAISAKKAGAQKVVLIERDERAGGILQQCIHNGFGLHKFKEELTGPEYGERYEQMTFEEGVQLFTDTTVTDLSRDRIVTCINETGCFKIKAEAVVLAMGCRERPRGALNLAGDRPSGVMTAGTAQKFVNIKGYMPGRKIVILGSGDIGLIMARRMTLEGAEVKAVCEIMEDSGGLTRNIVQCLRDFDIPLRLRHTVTQVHGRERVEGVTIALVDEMLRPVEGTEEYIECDTLMLSVGLIPENELSKKAGVEIDPKTKGPVVDENRQTTCEGIFACGNVVKVHELVDFVSEEGEVAGHAAACYAAGRPLETIHHSEKRISEKKGVKNLADEADPAVICTVCPIGCRIKVERVKDGYVTEGNNCKRGEAYAIKEVTSPERTLTTIMASDCKKMIPVKTDRPVPKEKIEELMKIINEKTLLLPISLGDIIIENIGGTGANVVCTRSFNI